MAISRRLEHQAPEISCLVVEDEAGIGWALRRLLEKAGASVTLASTGFGALAHVRRQEFAVVLLDVKLADADGFDLARHIKQLHPGTQIIMVSAYFYADDVKVREFLADGGACSFLAKPFRHEEVRAAFAMALAARCGRTAMDRTP